MLRAIPAFSFINVIINIYIKLTFSTNHYKRSAKNKLREDVMYICKIKKKNYILNVSRSVQVQLGSDGKISDVKRFGYSSRLYLGLLERPMLISSDKNNCAIYEK